MEPNHTASLSALLKNRIYWLVSITFLMERFIYYGFRSFLVLYLTDTTLNGGLELTTENALAAYGTFTVAAYLAMLGGGIICDVTQKYLPIISLSLVTMLLSLIWLSSAQADNYFVPMLAIGCASGVIKVCLYAKLGLIAQQLPQFSLNIFSGSQLFINLGAAMAPLLIGMTAESYGYQYALYLCSAIALIPLFTAQFGFSQTNTEDTRTKTQTSSMDNISNLKAILILAAIMALQSIFWIFYEVVGTEQYSLMTQTISSIILIAGAGSLMVLFIIGLFAFHHLSHVSSNCFTISFILIAVCCYLTKMASGANDATKILVIAAIIIALAEVLITAGVYSFISKYAKAKFMATTMGLLFFATFMANKLIEWVINMENSMILAMKFSVALAILIAVVVLVDKKLNQQKAI